MKVEIVTIGDELLIGQVTDTNSGWMARELNKRGFMVNRVTSVSDKEDDILSILRETTSRTAVVLFTGGLGPTRDDITKASLCKFFNSNLVLDQEVLSSIEQRFSSRPGGASDLDRGQAMVPSNCEVIGNPLGTAPVLWFNLPGGGAVIAMPGVPSEMKAVFATEVLPRLSSRFAPGVVKHKTIHVFNIPEAILAGMISEWEHGLPGYLKLAYLPSPGKVRLRLTGHGNDANQLDDAIWLAVEKLKTLIGEHIFGFDEELPQEKLLEMLKASDLSLSVAESCSGGLLAHLLTSIPGSSKVFKGGIIAYSNDVKVSTLGVNPSILQKHGAVSGQVAEQMAIGAREILKTDFAIAATGIAGPGGGSPDKPVGTTYLAWASKTKVVNQLFSFGNQRERNILRTAEAGIIVLKRMIEKGEV